MKQSHIITPRTLADSSFTVGHYTYRPINDRPSALSCLASGIIGLAMMAATLGFMLGYFDVLVK